MPLPIIVETEDVNFHLPLSWIFTVDKNHFIELELFKRNSCWLALVEANSFTAAKKIINYLASEKNNLIIRGCTELTISSLFHSFKKHTMLYGKEAVLSLSGSHFEKKSLKELIKRGSRHGTTIKVHYSKENIERLKNLASNSSHADEPQLKNLFVDHFHPSTELFVFHSHNGKWLGAMSVSVNSPQKLHTEVLLRHKNAPVGVMEALIYGVYTNYQNSEFHELSLGEVPFTMSKIKSINFFNKLNITIAGWLVRGAYNFSGLYKFKNKFNPIWNDIYLIGIPKLYYTDLIMLASKSNLIKLMLHKFFNSSKK